MRKPADRFASRVVLVWLALLGSATRPLAAQGAPGWERRLTLDETLRVGALEGEDRYTLGSVAAVLPFPNGGFWLADGTVPVVRRYAPDGTWLGDVGRAGEGPGEYLAPSGLAAGPDRRVLLFDGRLRRISTYSEDGSFLRSFPAGSGVVAPRSFVGDGEQVVFVKTLEVSGEGGVAASWIGYDLTGRLLDSIPIPASNSEGPVFVVQSNGGDLRPFTTRTLSALTPSGAIVGGRNDAYVLERRDMTSLGEKFIECSISAVRLLDAERPQWEARLKRVQEMARQGGGTAGSGPIPTEKPLFNDLWVDRDNRTWVRRHVSAIDSGETSRTTSGLPALRWREEPTWDVFDPTGGYLGTVVFPLGHILMEAVGDDVWTSVLGRFDEPYVIRFRTPLSAARGPACK